VSTSVRESMARFVPNSIAPTADVGAVLHEAADRVLVMLGRADESTTITELDELRRRWSGFVAAAAARRLKGSAVAQAVERRIELEIGKRLLNTPRRLAPELTGNDVWTCRTFARYEHVVLDVIAAGTNAEPPTQNRCVTAIRAYRHETGDVAKTGRRARRVPKARPASQRAVSGAQIAREVGGNTSVLYGLIRRAQAAHVAITDPANELAHAGIYRGLVEAEAQCVALLQAERVRSEQRGGRP
jgi:hypothetical protein